MGGVAKAIGSAVSGVAKAAGKVVEAVAENPIAVLSVVAAPAIAPAIATGLGVSPVAASAISKAVISGVGTAVSGGDFGDVLKSAAAAGFGSAVGAKVGSSVASSFGDTAGKVSAAASSSFTGTLIASGGDVEAALKAGVVGGGTAGAMDLLKPVAEKVTGVVSDIGKGTGTTTTTPGTAGSAAGAGRVATSPFGTSEAVGPTSPFGTTGTVGMPTITTPGIGSRIPTSPFGTTEEVSATSPFGTIGTVNQPSFSYPSMTYTPSAIERASEFAGKAAGSGLEALGSEAIESQLVSLLGLDKVPSQSTGPSPSITPGVAVTGDATQQISPAAASALAQALRVGDPGAPLFGAEGKGQQQAVWNTASLKFKDEVGG